MLAVMSVDGVNVLNGQTASTEQSGYVFNGYQRYEVTGWRKSNAEVAAFEFVASPASYARAHRAPGERRRDRRRPFQGNASPAAGSGTPRHAADVATMVAARGRRCWTETGAAGRCWPRQILRSRHRLPRRQRSARRDGETRRAALRRSRRAAREKLGTGHGEREWSQVTHTSFERAQSSPNETIRIRYDSYENLVSMG